MKEQLVVGREARLLKRSRVAHAETSEAKGGDERVAGAGFSRP
jgi:hypothetical protein